jgi:prepilin-type N-terminal cleavage/methylation domain-containing protein
MAAPRRVGGFTLIELLISITIMSLVIGLSTFAFSLFSRNWQGARGDFELAAGQLQRVELLNGTIRDAAAWLVGGGRGADSFGLYFLGREEGMTFVTESPVFDPRGLAVVRVFREREEGAATWRLVYEEAPLQGLLLRDATQVLPFQNRLVILRGLSTLQFRYFGWRSLGERTAGIETGALAPEWFTDYDGIVRQQQPIRIGLRAGDAEVFFEVAERDETVLGRVREMQ